MDNFILTHSDVIPDEICEYFIDTFEKEDKLGNTYSGYAGGRKDKAVKDCMDCIIHRGPDEVKIYEDIVNEKIVEYMNYYCPFSGKWKPHPTLKPNLLMHRYKPPHEGYHGFHMDWAPTRETVVRRMVVAMLYCNDVEEGGETEFYHQKLKIKPKKGTLVIWPTYFTHLHKGHSPISNTKYIINNWFIPAY